MLRFGLHRTAAGLATTLLLLVLSAGAAEAQEFNAGARALGIGGGFQALADDATAVFWNPAGAAILGDQLHVTVGSYSRVDERGNKDNEPVPGPSLVGATYMIDPTFTLIGAYYSPFVNDHRYTIGGAGQAGLAFQETRIEQFFNRLSLGFAKSFAIRDEGFLASIAVGGTADLSITSIDGELFDSTAARDRIENRAVAPGFSVGVLVGVVEQERFELKLGGTYHHPGFFDLENEGFVAFNRSASASRLYHWPLIAGGGIAVRMLESKTLVFLFDYQYVGWNGANRALQDSHNVGFGGEYAFFFKKTSQLILRAGVRRLEEPAREDPLSRGLKDHVLSATLGLGYVYQPREDPAFYAVDGAVEIGEEAFQFALSLTIGF